MKDAKPWHYLEADALFADAHRDAAAIVGRKEPGAHLQRRPTELLHFSVRRAANSECGFFLAKALRKRVPTADHRDNCDYAAPEKHQNRNTEEQEFPIRQRWSCENQHAVGGDELANRSNPDCVSSLVGSAVTAF